MNTFAHHRSALAQLGTLLSVIRQWSSILVPNGTRALLLANFDMRHLASCVSRIVFASADIHATCFFRKYFERKERQK